MDNNRSFDHLGNPIKSFPRALKLGKNDKTFTTSKEIRPRLETLRADKTRIEAELEETRVNAARAAMEGGDTKQAIGRQAFLERTLRANSDATNALEQRLREVSKKEKLESAQHLAADKMKTFEKEGLPKIKDLMKREFQREQAALIFRLENPGIALPNELKAPEFPPQIGRSDTAAWLAAMISKL